MSFAVFLYNVSVIISNLQRYIIIIIINKLTSNTKSVIYSTNIWKHDTHTR